MARARPARVAMLGLLALALVVGSAAAMGKVRRPDLVVRSLANPPASVAPGASFRWTLTVADVAPVSKRG